jgi:hypothetical protein
MDSRVMSEGGDLTPIDLTLRKAVGALQAAGVPFVLGGSLACWVRGGPRVENDVDLMVSPEDAEPALAALAGAGMRAEHPPERWLVKAYDADVCVDIIFAPTGVEIDRDYIARADHLSVLAIQMPVMAIEDVLVSRLLAIDDHNLDYTSLVAIARSLREQIDWPMLSDRVADSPYARAFLGLTRELGISAPASRAAGAGPIRVHRLGVGRSGSR